VSNFLANVAGILALLAPGAIFALSTRKRKKEGKPVHKISRNLVIAYYVILLVLTGTILLEAILMMFLGG
jgi:cytochrome c biogenesis factor